MLLTMHLFQMFTDFSGRAAASATWACYILQRAVLRKIVKEADFLDAARGPVKKTPAGEPNHRNKTVQPSRESQAELLGAL